MRQMILWPRLVVIAVLAATLCLVDPVHAWQEEFIRGDANSDAASNPASPVNIADSIYILGYLFSAGPVPSCLRSADANDDESVDLADAIHILGGLFSGGPAPSAPFPSCGTDPTVGALACESFPHCGTLPTVLIPGFTHIGTNAQGYPEYTLDLDPTVVLILIPGGTFDRGQLGVAEPVHSVTLTQDYLISKFEITNAQYKYFCDQTGFNYPPVPFCCGLPSDHFTNPLYADHPVVKVSWQDLNAPGGYLEWAGLVIPTEAQWEFAARGTTGHTYPWGNDAPDAGGVFRANGCWALKPMCPGTDGWAYTNPVAAMPFSSSLYSSPFGTVGQSGNVYEWCSDWADAYPSGPVTDPAGPLTGSARVIRGGGWFLDSTTLQAANRNLSDPSFQYELLGIRPAKVIP